MAQEPLPRGFMSMLMVAGVYRGPTVPCWPACIARCIQVLLDAHIREQPLEEPLLPENAATWQEGPKQHSYDCLLRKGCGSHGQSEVTAMWLCTHGSLEHTGHI